MSSTGPTPEEFDDDLDAEILDEDARISRDLDDAELRDQPAWLRDQIKPILLYRWYFIEYGADGRRVGQLHVRASTEDDAVKEARTRVARGQLLSPPVRWPGASF